MKYIASLGLGIAILVTACDGGNAPREDRRTVLDAAASRTLDRFAYDSLYLRWVGGEDCGACSNASGGLAWSESYLLESLVRMWESTEDPTYADTFARRAEAVLGATDSALGQADWAGRSLVGWSATKYSHDGEPIIMAEHTGLVVSPMLRFLLAGGDSVVTGPFGDRGFVLSFVRSALEDVEKNYRYDPRTGRGNTAIEYGAPQGGGPPLTNRHDALNSDAVLGLTYLLFWLVDGDPEMGAKARAIALHVRDNLVITDSGEARWRYYCTVGQQYSEKWDDIDHGALMVDFVTVAARHGVVFDRTHVEALGRTFLSQTRPEGVSKMLVGEGPVVTPEALCDPQNDLGVQRGAVGRWILLEPSTPAVGPIIRDFNQQVVAICEAGDAGLLLAISRSILTHGDGRPTRTSERPVGE